MDITLSSRSTVEDVLANDKVSSLKRSNLSICFDPHTASQLVPDLSLQKHRFSHSSASITLVHKMNSTDEPSSHSPGKETINAFADDGVLRESPPEPDNMR